MSQLIKLYFLMLCILFIASCASQKPVDKVQETTTPSTSATPSAPEILNSNQQNQLFKAVSHIQKDELKRADRILKSLYSSAKNNPQVASNYAVVLFKQDKIQQAKSIAAQFSDNSLANNIMGMIALKELDIKLAERYFLNAIELDKKNALAIYNAALLYDTYHQNLAKAVQYYEAYLKLATDDEDTRTWVKELKASL